MPPCGATATQTLGPAPHGKPPGRSKGWHEVSACSPLRLLESERSFDHGKHE